MEMSVPWHWLQEGRVAAAAGHHDRRGRGRGVAAAQDIAAATFARNSPSSSTAASKGRIGLLNRRRLNVRRRPF